MLIIPVTLTVGVFVVLMLIVFIMPFVMLPVVVSVLLVLPNPISKTECYRSDDGRFLAAVIQ
jgi:hypothetical protein